MGTSTRRIIFANGLSKLFSLVNITKEYMMGVFLAMTCIFVLPLTLLAILVLKK
jgi:hypothetical protein